MSDIGKARTALVRRILEGQGTVSPSDRRAAFNNSGLAGAVAALADKVASDPDGVTDGDIAAAKGSGLCEDQIFEIVVCAAIGQANRQYDAALSALEAATAKE